MLLLEEMGGKFRVGTLQACVCFFESFTSGNTRKTAETFFAGTECISLRSVGVSIYLLGKWTMIISNTVSHFTQQVMNLFIAIAHSLKVPVSRYHIVV